MMQQALLQTEVRNGIVRTCPPSSDLDVIVVEDNDCLEQGLLAQSKRGETISLRKQISKNAILVRQLPDLSKRLQEYGIFEEYQRQRHGYMKWRRGGASGAKGEITCAKSLLARELSMHEFKGWYRSVASFKWQRTCTFWVAVTFCTGSWLFAVGSFAACLPFLSDAPFQRLNAQITYAGNLYYSVGTYLMLLSVVNFNRHDIDVHDMHYNPFAYCLIRKRIKSAQMHMNSYHITLVYMIGVICYNVYTVLDLVHGAKPIWVEFWCGTVASVLGGLCFWVGGILEMKENDVFPFSWFVQEEQGAPFSAKATAVLDMAGGFLFFLPAFLGMNFYGKSFYMRVNIIDEQDGKWWSGMMWGVGSLMYVAGSMLSIWMWKNTQLGLVYMSNLNYARTSDDEDFDGDPSPDSSSEDSGLSRQATAKHPDAASLGSDCAALMQSSPQQATTSRLQLVEHTVSRKERRKKKDKLSFLTVLMVFSCSFFSAAALTNFLTQANFVDHHLDSLVTSGQQFFPVVAYSLVLVALTAVPRLPKEQPFRFLMLSARWLSFVMGFDVMYQTGSTLLWLFGRIIPMDT